MKHLIITIFLVFINMPVLSAQQDSTNQIVVNISNLSNNKGRVLVGLYNTKESFLGKGLRHLKTKIENRGCSVVFKDIPSGTYAISFYHDENENDKMDTNFMGIPKEDYGCSNNARGFMGPPKWEDAKFEVKNKSITQNITL